MVSRKPGSRRSGWSRSRLGPSVWERHKLRASRREKVDATCARELVVMASQASVLSSSWFDQNDQSRLSARLKRTLVLSLILHVVVLLVAVGLRLPQQGERPLTSVEVSLVSLPTPVRQAESAKPVESAKISDPTPTPAPLSKTMTASATPSAAPPRGEKRRDMLQDLQLPPDAPKFGDLSPASQSVAQPQQAAKVLDIPHVPDVAQDPVAKIPQRSTVSDDLDRELEEELKKIKQFQPAAKLDIPKEVKPSEASIKPVPQQEMKIPAVKTPDTTLRISGTAGSNPYWARVQSIISSQWEPPPIDMAGQTYTMIVKFRLQRDGTIKDVVVQQSSGNAYFDMAGQRAVLRPRVLPAFPADMLDSYRDVEMVFRVGESVG
ncbi:MAG: TonB family protein [Nitrospirae bacterium]|nr:MAG: TonB family protein [Nitrospirota bacterium]